jgi:hypothetical protein
VSALNSARVATLLPSGCRTGSLLEEFEIPHTAEGFREFFARVEACARRHAVPIAVAMEVYNGHVRPSAQGFWK